MLLDGLKLLWDLKNLMGIGFQMGQILWDFISQCDIWHVCIHWPRKNMQEKESILSYRLFGAIKNSVTRDNSSASLDKRCDAGYPCEKKINLYLTAAVIVRPALKICWFSVYWPTHLLTLYPNLFWSFVFFRSCLYTHGKKLSIISFCDKIFQKVLFPIAWRYWNF